MIRLWDTIGQALVDTNFRRYRVLMMGKKEKKDRPLNTKSVTPAKSHDILNKMPGRYPLSRFELAEVRRLFSIPNVVKATSAVCKQWHGFCKERGMLPQPSIEFMRALGLAASDTHWVKKITKPNANNPTEHVFFDLSAADGQCLYDFLRYRPAGGKKTRKLLKTFETDGWSSDCASSVTLRRSYRQRWPSDKG